MVTDRPTEHAQLIDQAQREAKINECDEILGRLRETWGALLTRDFQMAGLETAIECVEIRRQQLIREREAE